MTDVLTVATGNLSTERDGRLSSASLRRYASYANSSPHKADRLWSCQACLLFI